jgi:hypothetical protein
MIMIRVSSVRIQYMQAYVFVDDSNGEQVTTFHETTGTRELRALGLLNTSFVSRTFTTDTVRRGVARLCDRGSLLFVLQFCLSSISLHLRDWSLDGLDLATLA